MGFVGYMVGVGLDFVAWVGDLTNIGETRNNLPYSYRTRDPVAYNSPFAAYNTIYIIGGFYK